MASSSKRVRALLDIVAGEDDDSDEREDDDDDDEEERDEEDEDEDEEEWGGIRLENEGKQTCWWSYLRVSLNTGIVAAELDDDDDEHGLDDDEYARLQASAIEEHETERARNFRDFADSLLRNAMARGRSSSRDAENEDAALRLPRIPMEGDMPLYAIKTKVRENVIKRFNYRLNERKQVGFEFKTVLYAIREAEVREIEGVSSVFHVKNWPGRVFVEAKATKHAFNLLQPTFAFRPVGATDA